MHITYNNMDFISNNININYTTMTQEEQNKENAKTNKETKKDLKKRKISTSYTLLRFKETVKVLNEAKLVTEEEKQTLVKIYNDLNTRWISEKLEL